MDTTRFTIDEHGTARLQTSKGVLMLDAADLHVLERGMIKLKESATSYRSVYAELWTSDQRRNRIGSVARMIMDAPDGMQVDHINHDTLDNRRRNLRVCTVQGNARNRRKVTSKNLFKGIHYDNVNTHDGSRGDGVARPWRAIARVDGRRVSLGYFATQEEAAIAYDKFAIAAYGEFACMNFNEEDKTKVEAIVGEAMAKSEAAKAMKEVRRAESRAIRNKANAQAVREWQRNNQDKVKQYQSKYEAEHYEQRKAAKREWARKRKAMSTNVALVPPLGVLSADIAV
jgi:hypothetical protein